MDIKTPSLPEPKFDRISNLENKSDKQKNIDTKIGYKKTKIKDGKIVWKNKPKNSC